ncbi:response regulator [Actinomadura hibisca]|uniref:response regulator n=1 Tax=Actinomadura hibisca TaxID=68565 RepID=UPI000B0C3DCA|nr:response regulator [Actinomadura hibisca]
MTVLVVEDDPGDQMLIDEAFAEHAAVSGLGRQVMMVDDGAAALDFLGRSGEHADAPRPDLVVLDLNLPKVGGRAVLEKMKTDPDLRTIPVVIFSTSSNPDDISGTYQLHANAYITKPTDFDDFTTVVARIDDFFTRTIRLPAPDGPSAPPASAA